MQSVRNPRLAFYGCFASAMALLVLAPVSRAGTTKLTYLAGGLTLTANQSISVGSITLEMNSNCILALISASGQTLWQSGSAQNSCSSPEAAFDNNGSLVVSSIVNGQRSAVWASHTSGSSVLVVEQSVPYLAIVNSDGSPAWKAVGSLTLESINPPMMATIGGVVSIPATFISDPQFLSPPGIASTISRRPTATKFKQLEHGLGGGTVCAKLHHHRGPYSN